MPRRKLRVVSRKARSTGLTKLQKKSVKAIAKNVAMTIPEKKTFGFNKENQQLIHNKGAYLTSWLSCKQGTGDPDDQANQLVRIGDEYYLRNVNIRFWLSNKSDRPNVMYKCFLFWYDSNFSLSDATCFFTQTNKMLDRINNENISIIDQQTIFSGPSYAGTEREHSYLCTLKGKWKSKKITYDEGGTSPKKRDIGTCVVCYDAFGTLQTDILASYAYNGTVTIQDP